MTLFGPFAIYWRLNAPPLVCRRSHEADDSTHARLKDIMKRWLGLLTNWSEKILSAAPERVQQQARQKAGRLLRLVGGNPNAFLSAQAAQRRHDSGQVPGQSVAHKGDAIDEAIKRSQRWLLQRQAEAGYWVHELEADSTLTSEYLMLRRFLDLVDAEKERKAVRYLIAAQLPEGGWPIYNGGRPRSAHR